MKKAISAPWAAANLFKPTQTFPSLFSLFLFPKSHGPSPSLQAQPAKEAPCWRTFNNTFSPFFYLWSGTNIALSRSTFPPFHKPLNPAIIWQLIRANGVVVDPSLNPLP